VQKYKKYQNHTFTIAHKMSESTITIFSPVFTIHFDEPDESYLQVIPYAYNEEKAVTALGRAIIKFIQEELEINLSAEEIQQVEQSNTAEKLRNVFNTGNINGISYQHMFWVDFKLNKQVIKLPSDPSDKVVLSKRMFNEVEEFLGKFSDLLDQVNAKRARIN